MLILSIIFRLAAIFRLTIPLLYVIAMNTVCSNWYHAHESLAHTFLRDSRSGCPVLDHFPGTEGTAHFGKASRRKGFGGISSAAAPASSAGPVSQPDEYGGYAMDLSDIELSDDED